MSENTGPTVTIYTYDYDNRLAKVTQDGTVIAEYVQDALDDENEDRSGVFRWSGGADHSARARRIRRMVMARKRLNFYRRRPN